MSTWFPLILTLFILLFSVLIIRWAIRHFGNPPGMEQDEEDIPTVHWHVIQGGQGQQDTAYDEPPTLPGQAWLAWLAHFTWFQQWQYKHGWNRQEWKRARAALDLFLDGLDREFFDWLQRRKEEQSGQVIETTIHEIVNQPEQQEPISLSPLQLLNLELLKGEGRIALYEVYALGLLAYLYNHLPPSGTIHRDNNKSEPGWVGGQVISSTQWDQFIGSNNPNTQKGQGLLRRAGLLVERDLEGRRVTTFSTPDVGQAISILTQYLIGEQQGQVKPKDEQAAPPQRSSKIDEEEKVLPTQEYNWF